MDFHSNFRRRKMEDVIIKNEFDHSYMLIEMGSQDQNTYPFRMITQNTIPGLLSCKIRYIEEVPYYGYDVTSKQSLEKQYHERKIKFEELKELFYGINRILRKAKEFLLEKEGFLLEPQYIFIDLESEELFCLYLPGLLWQDKESAKGRYRELADFLLDKADHKDEHAVNTVYQFYKMSKEDFFSFDAFIGFMEKEELILQAEERRKEEKKNSVITHDREPALSEIENPEDRQFLENSSDNEIKWWIPMALAGIGIVMVMAYLFIPYLRSLAFYLLLPGFSFIGMAVMIGIRSLYLKYRKKEEDNWKELSEPVSVEEYFDDILDSETVFFEEASYCLKWKEGHFSKEYYLTDFPVTVGKMKESVQLHIDDASVSRLHARLKEKGNTIILQDLDSTNGTIVNGKRLGAGEEVIIKRNDEIQFGKIIVNVV